MYVKRYFLIFLVLTLCLAMAGCVSEPFGNTNNPPGDNAAQTGDDYIADSHTNEMNVEVEALLNIEIGELGVQLSDFYVDKAALQPHPDLPDWYIDDSGKAYLFDRRTDALCGITISYNSHATILNKLSSGGYGVYNNDELLAVVKLIASNIIDIEKMTISPISSSHFRFNRKISGFDTTEYGYVDIASSGDVIRFYFDNIGRFDDVIIPVINEQELDERFEAIARQQLYDTRGFIVDEIEIFSRVLDYFDGKPGMQYLARFNDGSVEMIFVPIE